MPQGKNNGIKVWATVITLVVLLATIAYAIVDSTQKVESAVEAHDTSASAHSDIRQEIRGNGNVLKCLQKTVDSVLIEQRHTNEDIEEIKQTTKHIRELLKDLKEQG